MLTLGFGCWGQCCVIRWDLAVVGAPMVGIPAALLMLAVRADRLLAAAASWPSVTGRMVEARYRDNGWGGRWVSVRYRYWVDGLGHEGRRFGLVQSNIPPQQGEAFVAAHPPGAPVQVWHDPLRPWRAVLQRTGGGSAYRAAACWIFGIFLAVFAVVTRVELQ